MRAISLLLLVYASYCAIKSTMAVFPDTYIRVFGKIFGGHCYSGQLIFNWDKIKIRQTNFFSNQSLNNPANISLIKISSYESSGSNYTFQTRSLVDHKIKFKVYWPIWANKSKVPKGVVIYFHQTLFGVKQVPINQTNYVELQFAIASLYANNGYVIVFPNYIGSDQNSSVPHPYVMYIAQNIQSAIVCLNDISQELRTTYNIQKINLISVGYSEGAAYSITMNAFTSPTISQKEKLNDFYTLKGSVGLQGPYDLLLLKDFLLDNQPQHGGKYKIWSSFETTMQKPSLATMILRSLLHYEKSAELITVVNSTLFFYMNCTNEGYNCSLNGVKDISDALKANNESIDIVKKIFEAAENRNNYTEKNNEIWRLFKTDILDKYRSFLIQNSAINNYKPGVPTYAFTLEYDSIFSSYNTINLTKLHNISSTIFPNENHNQCTNQYVNQVDHKEGEFLANVFALAFANNVTSQIQN